MRHWTLKEKLLARKLRQNGKTPLEIANILERTEGAIHRILSLEKKDGIVYPKLRHGRLKYDKERVASWRALWSSGISQKSIAKAENINPVIISVKLKQELYGELVH